MYFHNIAGNFYVQDNLLKLICKGAGNCKLCKYFIMRGNITSDFLKIELL